MTLQPVREIARGRWRAILPYFGIDEKALSGKQGPCPMCGGKTRFRFDDREGRGTWICNSVSCGAGDGLQLVLAKTGLDFKEAAKRIEELAGNAPRTSPRSEQTADEKRQALTAMWRAAKPVTSGDPVDLYLRSRLGEIVAPPTLRTLERCRFPGDVPSYHPAMIARMTDADGRPVMLHRTYLTRDGRKADVDRPRLTMPGHMPDGSAVRLMPQGPILGITEGIENAFAASRLFHVPVWSALNEVMLAKWCPPADVSELIVFGDNDATFVGQASAFLLARRISEGGTAARVMIPERVGADWNDVLMERTA